jgi:hypothetical protein
MTRRSIAPPGRSTPIPKGWEGYLITGYARVFQRRHAEAVAAGERAVALCPSGTDVHHMAGMFHGYDGNFRMAAHYEALAQRLSPLELGVQSIDHARARYHLGEFATARDLARRVLATNPRWLSAMTTLIAALWRTGTITATSRAIAKGPVARTSFLFGCPLVGDAALP